MASAINDNATLAAGVDGLVLANNIATTANGIVDNGGFTFTLNGDIGGAGSISSIGLGNLVLNGDNSFTNLGINQGTVTVGTDTAAGHRRALPSTTTPRWRRVSTGWSSPTTSRRRPMASSTTAASPSR